MAVESMQLDGVGDCRISPARAKAAFPLTEHLRVESSVAGFSLQEGGDSDPRAYDDRCGTFSMDVPSAREAELATTPLEPPAQTPGRDLCAQDECTRSASAGPACPAQAEEAAPPAGVPPHPSELKATCPGQPVDLVQQTEDPRAPGRTVKAMGPQSAPVTDLSAGREGSMDDALAAPTPMDVQAAGPDTLPQRLDVPQATAAHVHLNPSGPPATPSEPKPSAVFHETQLDTGTDIRPESTPKMLHNGDRLAACLACDICADILRDPVVSTECMHRYAMTTIGAPRGCVFLFIARRLNSVFGNPFLRKSTDE
jgi:hypothetical protein